MHFLFKAFLMVGHFFSGELCSALTIDWEVEIPPGNLANLPEPIHRDDIILTLEGSDYATTFSTKYLPPKKKRRVVVWNDSKNKNDVIGAPIFPAWEATTTSSYWGVSKSMTLYYSRPTTEKDGKIRKYEIYEPVWIWDESGKKRTEDLRWVGTARCEKRPQILQAIPDSKACETKIDLSKSIQGLPKYLRSEVGQDEFYFYTFTEKTGRDVSIFLSKKEMRSFEGVNRGEFNLVKRGISLLPEGESPKSASTDLIKELGAI